MSQPVTVIQLTELSQRAIQLEQTVAQAQQLLKESAKQLGDLASAISALEVAAGEYGSAYLYEADLTCGDTIEVRTPPAIGARRRCIHCDSSRKVVRVRRDSVVIASIDDLAQDDAALDRLRRMLAGEEL